MGEVWSKYRVSQEYVTKIIDAAFDSLPGGNAKKKSVTFEQLHETIIDMFKKFNEIGGARWVPPSKETMVKMIEECDLDKNKEIDREEFHGFVGKFSRHLVTTYAREILIVTVAVPAAAMLTARAARNLPKAVFYASAVVATLLIRSKIFKK
eukprot:PITA_07522